MRAMPSPTSITVPTSLTFTCCSNSAISRFRTLVISATLMAIDLLLVTRASRPCERFRHGRDARVTADLSGTRRDEPLAHGLKLRFHAGVDQLVADAHDDAADDRFVHVRVHHGLPLQRLADAALGIFEL